MMDLDDFLTPQDPEPKAPCGCDEGDCTPAEHNGESYCQACGEDLPFGFELPEQLTEPFCACGRVISQCDGSRKGCQK